MPEKKFTDNTYSPGDSDQSNSKSGFNFGDKKAFSYDIEDQVERMIAKMKRADLVNFSEDWKVNTITIHLRHIDARRNTNICALLLLFFGRIPCWGWPESSSSIIR